METLNTVLTWVAVALAVSAVCAFAIAAWISGGRSGSGGPPPGSIERDDELQEPPR